jgi:hypothetical protein
LIERLNDDLVDDDRAWRKVKGFKKVNAARRGYLTRDECIRLINARDPASGFRSLVHAALLTAMRASCAISAYAISQEAGCMSREARVIAVVPLH